MIQARINNYLIGRFMFCMFIGKVSESRISPFKKNSDFHTYRTSIASRNSYIDTS